MSRAVRLRFPGHDGKEIRVAHGAKCVVLLVERPYSGTQKSAEDQMETETGVVLIADEARALGRRLIQQANASETLA